MGYPMSSRPAYATMSTILKHKNLQKPEISLDKMPMSTLKYPESLIIRNMQTKLQWALPLTIALGRSREKWEYRCTAGPNRVSRVLWDTLH